MYSLNTIQYEKTNKNLPLELWSLLMLPYIYERLKVEQINSRNDAFWSKRVSPSLSFQNIKQKNVCIIDESMMGHFKWLTCSYEKYTFVRYILWNEKKTFISIEYVFKVYLTGIIYLVYLIGITYTIDPIAYVIDRLHVQTVQPVHLSTSLDCIFLHN